MDANFEMIRANKNYILSKFNGKTKEEIYEIIYSAYMKIKSADARVNSYILKEFKKVQFEIYNGYANGNIDFNGICWWKKQFNNIVGILLFGLELVKLVW